jgi:Zn-dependent protease
VILPLGLALSGAPVFGWAKPVPVDGRRLRSPRTDMMLVALAGPGMNLLLATGAALALFALGGPPPGGPVAFVAAMLTQFIWINVFLALFNLLPVPPFDGGHVVQGLLPRGLAAQYGKLARYGIVVMVLLLVVLPMLSPHANVVGRLVMPPAQWLAGKFLGLAG